MTFTFYNPRKLDSDEVNPYANLMSKALQNYQQAQQAEFLRPKLEEELKKARLFNQYYGREKEAEIGLKGAQTGEAGARAGYLGQQSKYYGRDIESQIAAREAQAQQAKSIAQKNALLQQILSGGNINNGAPLANQNNTNETNNSPLSQSQSYGVLNPQMIQQKMAQRAQESSQGIEPPNQTIPNQSHLTLAQATAAMHVAGLGEPKIINNNGRMIAITPFGNIDTGIQGQSSLQKQLAIQDAKQVGNLDAAVLSSAQKEDTLKQISSTIINPVFEEMRQNPILGKHELGWFSIYGTPEQKKLVGDFMAYTGQVIKDSASDFKGQFRVGEQGLLNSMKPNASDSLEVMQGKAESLMLMNRMLSQRAQVESELIRNGSSPVQAKIAADKIVDAKKIKEEIKKEITQAAPVETLKRIAGIR